MTNREAIYNALGIIEGAASVAQRNIRDVILDAAYLIRNGLDKEKMEDKQEEE